jgi:hypothetical protein
LDEVSGQLNDQLANANAADLTGFQDVLGADLNDVFGNSTVADSSLDDVLDAQTNQYSAFSTNITDNLEASAAGDNAIYTEYLGGLANPDVSNAGALDGLDEVSGQLNDQLANANATDLSGFDSVLGADFTNLGDFLGL